MLGRVFSWWIGYFVWLSFCMRSGLAVFFFGLIVFLSVCVPWCFRSSGTNDNIRKSDASRCYSHSARKMMNSRRLMLLGTKQKQGEDHWIKSKEQIPFHQRNTRFFKHKMRLFPVGMEIKTLWFVSKMFTLSKKQLGPSKNWWWTFFEFWTML